MAVRKRALAALAAGALLVPFASSSAYANHIDPRPVDQACPESGVEDNQFEDVEADNNPRFVNCIADEFYDPPGSPASAIATGTSPTTFSPLLNVTRRQMAQFIYREALLAGATFDTETDPGYTDDGDLTGEAQDAVFGLTNAGVLQGFGNRQFGPNNTITRAQMATFIVNINIFVIGSFTTTSQDFFDDDDGRTVHERNINRIAAAGITIGVGPRPGSPNGDRTYGFLDSVLRQQMAVFLARVLDIFVDAERVNPLPENISVFPDNERTATDTASNDFDFVATGLVPGQEYRIQLISEGFATRGADDEFTFTATSSPQGDEFFAATGSPQSDITFTNASATQNAGDRSTAVVIADENGEITFVVTGDPADDGVIAFVFRNGGDGNQPNQGGENPELEVTQNGDPLQPVDGSGVFRPFQPSGTSSTGLQA
jgi:hypothetical protein